MSIMELGALGEFVGAFAVVATLAYLAVQVRQNTGMMRAQISQARADRAASSAISIANSAYLPQILIKATRGDELTDEEMERYRNWFRGFNVSLDTNLRQYREGLLGEHIPRDATGAVRQMISGSQTSRDAWAASKHSFTDDYIAFVDSILREEAQQ